MSALSNKFYSNLAANDWLDGWNTVTGNGTAFTTELSVGDVVYANKNKATVKSITNDTSMVVEDETWDNYYQDPLFLFETGDTRFEATVESNYTTDEFGNPLLHTTGFIRNALNFSGGFAGLYVDAGANVDTSGAFSFAGWVEVSNLVDLNREIFTNYLGNNGYVLDINADQIRFTALESGIPTTLTYDLPSTGWYFVSATSDAGNAALYVGEKSITPTQKANSATFNAPASADQNMSFLNVNGYTSIQLMYQIGLNLTKITEIWNNTKNLI